LGGGPHHFSKHADHVQSLQWQVEDSFIWPQEWLSEYVSSTAQLISAIQGSSGLLGHPNVCVLWRTNNVGPRANGAGPHHPSARNGLHDWLNRFTIPMMQRANVGVLDTTDLTSAHAPSPQMRADGLREGDLYHGYNATDIVPLLCTRTCSQCSLRWGDA
jgi:hypothetical protein